MSEEIAERASARLAWATEILAVESGDRLLEIGCGHGVAVSLICGRLDGGCIVAIDRSATMIGMATKRNRAQIAAGKAILRTLALERADFGGERFDKVFAVNVSPVWWPAGAGLDKIKGLLEPGGQPFLSHQLPDRQGAERPGAFVAGLTDIPGRHGFAVARVVSGELEPMPAICVIAHVAGPARANDGVARR